MNSVSQHCWPALCGGGLNECFLTLHARPLRRRRPRPPSPEEAFTQHSCSSFTLSIWWLSRSMGLTVNGAQDHKSMAPLYVHGSFGVWVVCGQNQWCSKQWHLSYAHSFGLRNHIQWCSESMAHIICTAASGCALGRQCSVRHSTRAGCYRRNAQQLLIVDCVLNLQHQGHPLYMHGNVKLCVLGQWCLASALAVHTAASRRVGPEHSPVLDSTAPFMHGQLRAVCSPSMVLKIAGTSCADGSQFIGTRCRAYINGCTYGSRIARQCTDIEDDGSNHLLSRQTPPLACRPIVTRWCHHS